MTIYSFTSKGNRETNEDYISSVQFGNNASLHIVADGMGGYLYGEIAAKVATDAIVQYISERYSDEDITSTIQQAIKFANEEIALKRRVLHAKLGTTLAGFFIRESIAYAFWLGDVQIQQFRDNKLLFSSESHSLINEMKKNGVVSTKDLNRYKNIVTKSLSGHSTIENVSVAQLKIIPDDVLLICSDGFYNSIAPFEVISIKNGDIDEKLKKFENSNEDNFSIIKVCV